ncbi:MAG: hypothetical protein WC277_02055 [Bacilli bacterium]
MRLEVKGTGRTTAEVTLDGERVRHAIGLTVQMGAGHLHQMTLEVAPVDPELEIEDVDPTVLIAGRRFRLDPDGAVAYVGTYTTIVTAPALTDLPGPAHLSRARTLRDLLAPYQGKRVRITIEPLPAPEKTISPGGEGSA